MATEKKGLRGSPARSNERCFPQADEGIFFAACDVFFSSPLWSPRPDRVNPNKKSRVQENARLCRPGGCRKKVEYFQIHEAESISLRLMMLPVLRTLNLGNHVLGRFKIASNVTRLRSRSWFSPPTVRDHWVYEVFELNVDGACLFYRQHLLRGQSIPCQKCQN